MSDYLDDMTESVIENITEIKAQLIKKVQGRTTAYQNRVIDFDCLLDKASVELKKALEIASELEGV